MSLRDGTKKMSKSDLSDYSRIHLTDNNDDIALKIRKARTDSEPIPDNVSGLESRPEARNLLDIYAILNNQSLESVCQQFSGQLFSAFKPLLTEVLINVIAPIRTEMQALLFDKNFLTQTLRQGAEKANHLANNHLNEIRGILGIIK